MAHELFCHPAILQFLMADISFNIACKQLKIAQIAQLYQLFQLLHLVHIYGHGIYELSCMLMRKNVNNDVTKCLLEGLITGIVVGGSLRFEITTLTAIE